MHFLSSIFYSGLFFLASNNFAAAVDNSIFLPSPKGVLIKDLYSKGIIMNSWMKQCLSLKKMNIQQIYNSMNINLRPIGFGYSLAKCTFTKESFRKLVYDVMFANQQSYTKENIHDEQMTNRVIDSIYHAAVKLYATDNELIIFTSIAMFNNYLFFRFPGCDRKETRASINGKTSRGLLQLTSIKYYDLITRISSYKINYLEAPYMLNTFTAKTIEDEFKLFKDKFYNKSNIGTDYNSSINNEFTNSIIQMNSKEARLLSIGICDSVSTENLTKNELKCLAYKLKRRKNILNSFIFYMSKMNDNLVVTNQFLNITIS